MSSNRLIYDTCAYSQKLGESVGPLKYMLNPMKYENSKKCRHEKGLLGSHPASLPAGNLVDLENDLKGITRKTSLCAANKYSFQSGMNPNLNHLKSCQMIDYKKVKLTPGMKMQKCVHKN